MAIDFQKQNGMYEKTILVKQLYERFNMNYGNPISTEKIDNAINSMTVVKSDMSNVPYNIQRRIERGARALNADGRIYVKSDVTIDTLFHEILHHITGEHKGVQIPLANTYSEEEITEQINKYGENRLIRQFEQLDESMTRFITELAIPEVQINDSYAYGAGVIKNYYDSLVNNGIDPSFVLNMYLTGNQDDIEKFKNSFGDSFGDVLNTIERANNIRLYALKQPQDSPLTNEEMLSAIEEAVNRTKVR